MKKTILICVTVSVWALLMAFNTTTVSNSLGSPLQKVEKPVTVPGDSSKPCKFISDVKMLDNKSWPGEFVKCIVETNTYKINSDTTYSDSAGLTSIRFQTYRKHTTTQNLCSYKAYHSYNLRHNEEMRVYNSALVIRCQ